MMETGQQKPASLYVHFPFCETKCHYCDFFSLPEAQVQAGERARIYRAIARELELRAGALERPLKTVFLGGGTPSLVPLETLGDFVSRLPVGASTEITMEANPSSITLERAKAWHSFGVNRFSMGVQALDDERLKWLSRVHSLEGVFHALESLFSAGIRNVSIDYIVGVPGQTVGHIERELGMILERFPHIRHLSAYLLTLKGSNSKFRELPSDDEQLDHLRAVSEALTVHGFEQYEISNFARPGARALHNENYWLGGSYVGVGPSAHSYEAGAGRRAKNWASLGKYCELIEAGQPATEWSETLDCEQQRLEYLMLRLRRSAGVELKEYAASFGRDLLSDNARWIEAWIGRKLCVVSDGRLQLTADGFFLSDQILSNIC